MNIVKSENVNEDCEAWEAYPKLHKWFNKLWLSEQLGYTCGPGGTAPKEKGHYVVRPIYNLSGMGVGAKIKKIKPDDYESVKAGYFWCERFNGEHYSVDYIWVSDSQIGGSWTQKSSYQGTNFPINLAKFAEWKKSEYLPKLPDRHKDLWKEIGYGGVRTINVEWVGDKIVELHLRPGNIYNYSTLVPVWKSWPLGVQTHWEHNGFSFIEAFDDGDGQLKDARLGFMVK